MRLSLNTILTIIRDDYPKSINMEFSRDNYDEDEPFTYKFTFHYGGSYPIENRITYTTTEQENAIMILKTMTNLKILGDG